MISVLNGPAHVVPRHEPWGTHHPDGVLIANGPGLQEGIEVDRHRIVDVTALMAYSIGLNIPSHYDSSFPEALFDPEFLVSEPPRFETAKAGSMDLDLTQDAVAEDTEEEAMSEEEEAMVLERLKSLGYIQ